MIGRLFDAIGNVLYRVVRLAVKAWRAWGKATHRQSPAEALLEWQRKNPEPSPEQPKPWRGDAFGTHMAAYPVQPWMNAVGTSTFPGNFFFRPEPATFRDCKLCETTAPILEVTATGAMYVHYQPGTNSAPVPCPNGEYYARVSAMASKPSRPRAKMSSE